jgi:hypothetical protein
MPHLDTHSTHSSSAQVLKEVVVVGCRKKEEREVCCLALDILFCLVHYLGIILAIYIKEVFLGFLPLEVSQDKCLCTLVIVFLSVILSMLLLSSKLKVT